MSCSNNKPPPPYTHTVIIEKPNATTEANGQENLDDDANWVTAWRTRARFVTPTTTNVTTASGLEVDVGNQLQALAPVAVFVPYSSDSRIPLPSHRIRLGNRRINIIYAKRVNENGPEVFIKAIERILP